tara:strand:+ start:1135 stop:3066 length:1932 start_codon:yes stop_codon:yes gene_type:complete
MPFTKFTNLDFDQIRTSIKDYLRANSTFTDFDFEGSNFSVLIDTLAYNTYITAFNSNMIVNESFLDSATLRENVVSLARNIGYVPRSRTCSKAQVTITGTTSSTESIVTIPAGLVCVGTANDTSYTFCTPENISTTISNGSVGFSSITVYQGTFLKKTFTVDGSLDQRFVLDNANIDTSTISVYVRGINDSGDGVKYSLVENILNIDSSSQIYLIQEVQDEKYELLFGDGRFGKKLDNNSVITVYYITTDGSDGNGASQFSLQTTFKSSSGSNISLIGATITTNQSSINGGEIEAIDSIKYFAPRIYSSQYRAVTARDYEAIIKKIYPDTESVAIVGGEELDPPEYGTVSISIKPKNGTFVSEFNKEQIKNKLKQYSVSGINQKIIDLKILYVEIDSSIYYNSSQVSGVESLKTKVTKSLTDYSNSTDLNKFGGRFKYSKVLQIIDNTDTSITSNITKVIIRRDLKVTLDNFVQYELCFGNKFHYKSEGYNIKSTGFKVLNDPDTVYFTDVPNKDANGNLDGSGMGILSVVKPVTVGVGTTTTSNTRVVVKSAGTIDYNKGEIKIGTLKIISTSLPNSIIEIQAYPESNDILGLKDLYLNFNLTKSSINMVRDVVASGDEISGTVFARDFYTSSYSNGNLIRK